MMFSGPARALTANTIGLSVLLGAVGLWAIAVQAGARKTADRPKEPALKKSDRSHWAFQKPIRPRVPKVNNLSLAENPLDAFILARLEKAGLALAPAADRATLLRRLSYDLTGLPPAPAELQSFLQDRRPSAYARVVERLLASPHYGEHWALHWLDVVRFAESNGYEIDSERPDAWRYRDYVIRAFNEDKPYDCFVREQLAGDGMATGGRGQVSGVRGQKKRAWTADHCALTPDPLLLIASGFNRCGPVHLVTGNTDPEVNRQEVLTEMTGAVGSAFLGLTVACARCHNHKFDPVSQADYYRLQAFFAAAQPQEIDIASPQERADHARKTLAVSARLTPLRRLLAALDAPYQARLVDAKKKRLEVHYREALATDPKKRSPAQQKLAADAEILIKVTWDEIVAVLTPGDRKKRAQLRAQINALEAQLPPPIAHAWTVREEASPPPTYILKRGDPKQKGVIVEPAFPRVLSPSMAAPRGKRLNRIDLARWLTRPGHPLTARAMVNRIWQHHFGRGIVATPNDFGFRGEPPSHPELLDWLACEFVSHGWSVKKMHRLIVLSRTYRQAGRKKEDRTPKTKSPVLFCPSRTTNRKAMRLDPDNRLLWHMPRQRLRGEALRDAALAVTGTLYGPMGGPAVRVPLEKEVYELIFTEGEPDGLWHVTTDARMHNRRSIYLFNKRNVRLPLFEAFDKPDTLTSCPVRPGSTFAPQALILMNGPFMQEQSQRFAARLLRECDCQTNALIERAYWLALSRPPRSQERALARHFLASQADFLRDRLRSRQPVRWPVPLPGDIEPAAAAALVDFCLALLNCNEFVYVQ
jgi:hypothetical protein